MSTITLPGGTPIIKSQPFSREPFEHMFDELCAPGHDFTGYVQIDSSKGLYLLFLHNSRPYSAARITSENRLTISIKDFFKEVGLIDDTSAAISINTTDPVLLKSLLVYSQNVPTFKAPAEYVDIDAVLEKIGQESADCLITLETGHKLDFCFFKNGTNALLYQAEPVLQESLDLPAAEQVRSMVSNPSGRMDFMIYRDIGTVEASDSLITSQKEMLELLRGQQPAARSRDCLQLTVLEGPLKGKTFSGPIPCVLGRKDTDIIVSDSLVSKRHATIQLINSKLIIMDLNSTNGTYLNGNRVSQHEISVGDDILLGATMMKIEKLAPA